ncbi:TetR family transcriptional regulator [Kitasatospora phosalacinea]|uniref:TetR family transcriptional regulator n=1 Tax=Kitasatospora phosalacinea TaxID=2065 RepID=UPI0031580E28
MLDRLLALAVAAGLEGVTIGALADDLGMSKAGVIGPFGTKEELHLAAVEETVARFRETVLAPPCRPGPTPPLADRSGGPDPPVVRTRAQPARRGRRR